MDRETSRLQTEPSRNGSDNIHSNDFHNFASRENSNLAAPPRFPQSPPMSRHDNRQPGQIRPITIEKSIAPHAQGSVLISFGNTKVICAAMIEESVPRWMKEQNVPGGWVTAEYSMLPYSTLDRKPRELGKGRPEGRTVEIQRLIGRSLRAVVDLQKLGQHTLWIDCDVLQADGGTRTASICGGYLALHDACERLVQRGTLRVNPVGDLCAGISVGIVSALPSLDLDYVEDSSAEVDMNVVMTGAGKFVEVQGTAEGEPFARAELDALLALAALSHASAGEMAVQQRGAGGATPTAVAEMLCAITKST